MRRPKTAWICLAICYALLIGFCEGLLAAPPGKLPFYLAMVAVGAGMIVVEAGIYRWIGVLLVLVSVLLSASEFKEGYELRRKVEKVRSR